MEFFTKEQDGSIVIREFVGKATITNESLHAFTEAKKATGKGKLVVTIAGIHEGVTRNLTEYLSEEMEKSIPTWTAPYGVPVLVNHDQGNVNATVGRVINVQMGEHNSSKALMFTVELTDPTAIEKVKDNRYYTVSIGTRVGGVKCSICGNDWAESYCEHERGHYYLTDENDPKSAKKCTWQILGMEGLEISYVAVPSDKNAMNVAASHITDNVNKNEALDDLCAKLYMFSESGAIDLIKKDGTMEHVGEEEVVSELLDVEEEEVAAEDEAPEEETVEVEEPAEEVVEDEAEEEVADGEPAEEEVEADEEEVAEPDADEEEPEAEEEEEVVAEESAEIEELNSTIAELTSNVENLRIELRNARIELLLSVKGLDNVESDEANDLVSRYENVDEQVLLDLIRGERANKIANGLAEVRNSVSNPTLTEDPVDKPHNPSENKTSVKVKVKGSNKTLSITPKEDRIKSVKVRR